MNRRGRFDLWISGILAVVCLLLLNGLVREFQKGPRQWLVVAGLARAGSVAEHPPKSSPEHHASRPIELAGSSNTVRRGRLQPQARTALHSLASKQAKRIVSKPSAEAQMHTIDPPQPKTITLEPLGYVEKAGGRVEAIISVGDRVQVVHEGEIVEDGFRVVKISSSAVEVLENSAPPVASQVIAQIGQGGPQTSPGKSMQVPSGPVSEVVSNTEASRQFAADSAVGGSLPAVRQEFGYVERKDGRVEAIIAEGEHVRLSQASKSFANEFHGPAASPADFEVANASPPVINPPDSVALESQPLQTNSLTHEAGGAPLVVLGPEPSNANNPQGIPASNGGAESEPPSLVQPEPLADYSGNRSERITPGTLGPTLPPIEPSPPPERTGNQSEVRTLGYVEKTDGEKEAIVEVFGQVYLVHEGELFAGKYRALHVAPSSVEIVVESRDGSGSPSQIGRDSGDVRPPVSRWRGPPLPAGSPGTDPPVEVGKTEESVACKPAVSPSKPPPEHPVEPCERPKGHKTSRTCLKDVRLVERSAKTDTRSPPGTLDTVGFVEKASGETEAIVAAEGGVYLVPSGRVSLDNSKIPNLLPGLEISPLGIRAFAFPDLLSELPIATSQIESTQILR